MGIDGLSIHHLSIELNKILQGGRIDKITQSSKDFFQLHVYVNRQKLQLLLSTISDAARVTLSKESFAYLQTPQNFCMLLRKHLQNATIDKIEQVEYERIIAIHFTCSSEFTVKNKVLYCEIMGKYSNLILVQDGVILGALKSIPLTNDSKRNLLTGASYTLPPKQDKLSPFHLENLKQNMPNFTQKTFANFLFSNIAGLSLQSSREITKLIAQRLKIEENSIIEQALQDANLLKALQESIYYFLIESPASPSILFAQDIPKEFYPLTFDGTDKKSFTSFIECIECFYQNKGSLQKLQQKTIKLKHLCTTKLYKEEKKLQMLLAQQEKCKDLENNRLYGELITANIYAIKKGDTSCSVINYYSDNQEKCTIPLDAQRTPSENAQAYYSRYNKQKRTLTATAEQIEKVQLEIDYWTSTLQMIDLVEELEDLVEIEAELLDTKVKKRQNKTGKKNIETSKYRQYNIENYTVCVGRNNLQNDRLLKESREHDIWLHAQKLTSAHAIIFTNKQSVPESVIHKAAEIVAYFSSGRENGKVSIDYCLRKYVKKPPKSKAGFVTYSQFKTVLVVPNKNENLSNK